MRRTTIAFLILFAASAFGGVNRWTTSGPDGVLAWAIASDATDPNVLFVWTPAGIYRTTDGAASWVSANEGLKSTELSAFVATPDALYAAIDSGAMNGEIWASTDRGEHWSKRAVIADAFIRELAFDATRNTLYAMSLRGGGVLLSSTDGGVTWAEIPTSRLGSVYEVLVSQTAIYLRGSGFSRSIDGGATWQELTGITPNAAFANPDSRVVFIVAGLDVFMSNDDGKTWAKLPQPKVQNIYSIRMVASTIYAATSAGILVYKNGSWTLFSTPVDASSVVVTSSSPLTMYVTTFSGVLTYKVNAFVDSSRGLPHPQALHVAVSKSQPATAYATTLAATFRTDDAGDSWRMLVPFDGDLAVSPTIPETVYCATTSGVVKSTDAGATWHGVTPSSRFTPTRIAIAPSDPATLYAVLSEGMWKSANGGETWTAIGNGLSPDYFDYYGFTTTAMAVDPANADNVAIAKYSGVFVTTDGGRSWQNPTAESEIPALAFDSDSTLYGARADVGVEESFDFGRTWSAAGLSDKRVTALATAGTSIFAATADGHVYRSDDRGVFWTALDEGLSRGAILELAADATGNRLYAATAAGFYEFDLARDVLGARSFTATQSIDDYLSGASAVIPVAGRVAGANAVYTTAVTLSNRRREPRPVVLAWLSSGGGSPTFFRATLPPGDTNIFDINDELGVRGIGALAVLPVSGDSPASDASIGASARVWSHVFDGRAPFAQSIDAATSELLGRHGQSRVTGLAPATGVRVNIGIVNLSASTHQFTVGGLVVDVPAFSLQQIPLPDSASEVEAFADDARSRWILYASEINGSTGEARTILGQIN